MNRSAARKDMRKLMWFLGTKALCSSVFYSTPKIYMKKKKKKICDSFCTPEDRQVCRRRLRAVKIGRKIEDRTDSSAYKIS